jgi:hypothetical protein
MVPLFRAWGAGKVTLFTRRAVGWESRIDGEAEGGEMVAESVTNFTISYRRRECMRYSRFGFCGAMLSLAWACSRGVDETRIPVVNEQVTPTAVADRKIPALWESEWETKSEKIWVWVEGYHSGEPWAVLLVRSPKGVPPPFHWQERTFDGATKSEIMIAGRVIKPAKEIQLIVNGPDGAPRELAVDQAALRRLFHRDAPRTLDTLLRFWDDYVKLPPPELIGHDQT